MEFFLNGQKKTYSGDPELSLLNYLRNIEGIITPKDGCSSQGTCGACTVEVDNKAILSCTTPMRKLENKKIITTDGLEQKIQDAFSRAFIEKGGIQCGFCTPGIIMAAKNLLTTNPNPTAGEIKKTINKNLCRCTGYKKIIDSILYTAEFLKSTAPEKEKITGKVGTRLPKYDSARAVLGLRPFVCDLKEKDMLFGALKFSDHPRALVKIINIKKAKKVKGVIGVFTAKDIPGARIGGLIIKDWPLMVMGGEETRYVGDVLASVVAITEEIAREAVDKIKIEYEVLTPISTMDSAMSEDAPKLHKNGNILSECSIKRGNMDMAEKETAFISEGTFQTQRIEHAFLETECALAKPTQDNSGIEIYSQTQGPYEDRKQIASILNIPEANINVIQVSSGGGFGGKEDMSVQGHTAMAAFLLKKPVKFQLTRHESMLMHPKRHPFIMNYKIGCNKDGKLTFLKAKILGDTGAYASVGMKVVERGVGHASGAYHFPVVDVNGLAVYTNNSPCGAMRGFGVNQVTFALESSIEELCRKGGFNPWEFRFYNALEEGSLTATGQKINKAAGVKDTLLAVKKDYEKAIRDGQAAGIACGIKNCGIGNGMVDFTNAKIVIESEKSVVIHHGWSEMGQGVHTMAIQSVCEETGIDPEVISVKVETKEDTLCGMTTSSRGTSMVGHALIDACTQLKKDLKNKTLKELSGNTYHGTWKCDWTTRPGKEKEGVEPVTHYSYSYATQLVVLKKNGEIEKVIAAHDAGKIMNPTLFEGQIEGSVHMGLGYALTEDFPLIDSVPVFTKLSKCGIIRANDTPEIIVKGVEVKDPHGPFGAKGVGEVGMVPTAGAVAAALYNFDNKKRTTLPLNRK